MRKISVMISTIAASAIFAVGALAGTTDIRPVKFDNVLSRDTVPGAIRQPRPAQPVNPLPGQVSPNAVPNGTSPNSTPMPYGTPTPGVTPTPMPGVSPGPVTPVPMPNTQPMPGSTPNTVPTPGNSPSNPPRTLPTTPSGTRPSGTK